MANTIQIKRSSTASDVPTVGQLEQGELALNIVDEKLYSKNSSDAIFEIGGAGIADGTVEGQMLRWDVAGDEWEATDNMLYQDDGANPELLFYTAAGATLSGSIQAVSNHLQIVDSANVLAIDVYTNLTQLANNVRIEGGYLEVSNTAANASIKMDMNATAGALEFSPQLGSPTRVELNGLDLGILGQGLAAEPTAVADECLIWACDDIGTNALYSTTDQMTVPLDNVHVGTWRWHSVLHTGSAPSATLFRTDSATCASITEIALPDLDLFNDNSDWFTGDLEVGDVLTIRGTSDRDTWVSVSLDVVTDNTTWWELEVTVLKAGTVAFTNAEHYQFELQKTSAAAVGVEDWLRADVADTKTAGILRFNDSVAATFGSSDDVAIDYNGTNFRIQGGTNQFAVLGGMDFRIYGSGGTGYAGLSHDNVDANLVFGTTTDLNVTGLTAIQAGTVDADFDAITGTTFNGVALTTGGVATNYLDETGNYSAPAGGTIGGSITNTQVAYGAVTADDIAGHADFTWDGVALELGQSTGNKYMRWYDSAANFVSMRMSGTTNSLFVEGTSAEMVLDSVDLRLRDNNQLNFGEANDVQISWDGTDLEIVPLAGGQFVNFRDNQTIRIYDTNDTGYLGISHDASYVLFNSVGASGFKFQNSAIFIEQLASAPAHQTSYGCFWERNDAPSTPWHTDDTGVDLPLGYNSMPPTTISASQNMLLAEVGYMLHKSSGVAITLTCAQDSNTWDGATWAVHNDDTEDLTITAGASVTIYWLEAGAAPASGDVTVEQGGIVTIYKLSNTEFWVWGNKAAGGTVPTQITIADESADTTCFPMFATAATGDVAPKSGTNLTFNSSTGNLVATLIAGIPNANLLDKSVVETVSGQWIFSAAAITLPANIWVPEDSGAATDSAGYGQFWVKNNAPGDPYFTGDTGVDYPLAYATYRRSSASVIDHINQTLNMTTDSVADAMVGAAWIKTNTTAYTLTLEPSTDEEFPVGSQVAIYNRGASGVMTVTEGTGTTLYVLDGSSSTDAAGSATIAAGGYATLIRETAAIYVLMGAGVTP